jgi:hypothetical protein
MTDVWTSEQNALFKQLVDMDKMLYCGDGIKSDIDHSKMPVRLFPLITFEPLDTFSWNLVRT